MEITIEIGNENDKKSIKKEIQRFMNFFPERTIKSVGLSKIIVPINFEKTINIIEGTNSYKAERIHLAIARIIEKGPEKIIVFSHLIYTNKYFDFYARLYLFLHEFYHLVNRTKFKIIKYDGTNNSWYLNYMGVCYDEYSANKFPLSIILKKENSRKISKFFLDGFYGHIKCLLDRQYFYTPIKNEINALKLHGDIQKFFNGVSEYVDTAIKSIIYTFSYIDSSEFFKKKFESNLKYYFINNNTINLIDRFRLWYKNNQTDFSGSINLIKLFIKNFGLLFEDTIHVIDI